MKIRLVTKDATDPNNDLYLESVEFFLKKLLGDVDYDHVERVDIKTDAIMGIWGECFTRKLVSGKITVRMKFRHKLNFLEDIRTLAHECVHAGQFITGKLRISSRTNCFYWINRNYGENPYAGLTTAEIYQKLPWEREAIALEDSLVKEYIDYYYGKVYHGSDG